MATTDSASREFPANWQISADFDPSAHLMQLKGRDYMNVQNRMLWFLRDQRRFIADGLATCPYIIETRLVELDREVGFAHFCTYVRDALGNESTMYGSESAKDFGDFAEKASTKSLGRALLALGYGTAFAPEMDEGERVVDAPVERKKALAQRQDNTAPATPAAYQQHPPLSEMQTAQKDLVAQIQRWSLKTGEVKDLMLAQVGIEFTDLDLQALKKYTCDAFSLDEAHKLIKALDACQDRYAAMLLVYPLDMYPEAEPAPEPATVNE